MKLLQVDVLLEGAKGLVVSMHTLDVSNCGDCVDSVDLTLASVASRIFSPLSPFQ